VAVVVNYRGALSAQGKRGTQALSATELEQIKNLVKETMGFSAERGDSLNVVNSPFAADPAANDAPELPWWRQPDNIELAKVLGKYLLLGALALYLWFAVLRPLLRKQLHPAQGAPLVTGKDKESAEFEDAAVLAQAQAQAQAQERQNQRHQENINFAQEIAGKDPQVVAMLMKHWIGNPDE